MDVQNLNVRNMQSDMSSQPSVIPRQLPDRGLQPHSCVICQRRKVKCDRISPCSNCVKHRVDCEFRAPAPPRRRKRQSPDPHIHAKLRRYEDILQKHGVKLEDFGGNRHSDEPSEIRSPSARAKSEASLDGKNGPATPESKPSTGERKRKPPQSTPYAAFSEEFKHLEELLEGSDNEDRKPGPSLIQRAFDRLHADGSGLLFGFGVNDDLKKLHPAPINIFRLWQTYLNCVYPISMIFHAPTVQQQILDASANLENVSESVEALMFAIYYAAVVALPAEECEAMFGLPQPVVVNKHMLAAQRALNAAKLLKSLDITILQALVIFLLASRQSIDPRSLWVHCGTAIRLGQRIGLHRDGALLGLPPFETEMRRRLWWQIVVFDTRIAELSGSGTSILSAMFDTRLPSNVNDSNLSPEMGDMPPDHTGTTDMTFVLARYEISDFLKRSNAISFSFDNAWIKADGAPSTIAEKDTAIDELEQQLEKKYLKHCDPQITLHFLTKMFSRTAIYRMRLVAHHPRHYPDKGASMPTEEKDLLCRLSVNMIENDNIVHRNASAHKFSWWIDANFQFPAFIYLISELRHRTRGELADRGWQALNESFGNRIGFIAEKKHSPMFHATSQLALKAWLARELDAAAHNEPSPEPPEYILTLRSIFGDPSPSHKKQKISGAAVDANYLHTPADSTNNQGDNSSSTDRSEKQPHTNTYNKDSTALAANNNDNALEPGSTTTTTTDWSPMDWTYWDELIQNWEPQIQDIVGSEQFNFGQPFQIGGMET